MILSWSDRPSCSLLRRRRLFLRSFFYVTQALRFFQNDQTMSFQISDHTPLSMSPDAASSISIRLSNCVSLFFFSPRSLAVARRLRDKTLEADTLGNKCLHYAHAATSRPWWCFSRAVADCSDSKPLHSRRLEKLSYGDRISEYGIFQYSRYRIYDFVAAGKRHTHGRHQTRRAHRRPAPTG